MKLVDGKYRKITWEEAINEIGDKLLAIRKESGPDAVFWLGSSKHSNEQSYMFRKFVSMFGTNNMDHQARICHSTTVAGVANTWGYGAMTNSYNDLMNSKAMFFIGSNAAEAHPVSMLHCLHAKETGAKMIVCDPRFTRTAAKADQHIRMRSGTDIAILFGMLYHIFKNGWEDQKYLNDRVFGMDKVREDVLKKWTPDKVTEVCGVPEAEIFRAAETMAKNRPSTDHLVHGTDAALHRQRDGARELHPAAGAGQRRRLRRRHQHLPRPRQRAGRDRRGPEPGLAAGLLRHRRGLLEALVPRLGRRLRVDEGPLRLAGDDGEARHDALALDRRRDSRRTS